MTAKPRTVTSDPSGRTPASSDPGILSSRLVRAKLLVPRMDRRAVQREAVNRIADNARDVKMVLFRAPSGFGKTTAMRQYFDLLENQGRAVAWLTLDGLDDDFRRLLVHLVAAFDSVLSIAPEEVSSGNTLSATDPDRLAFDLVSRIALAQSPFTVFIDDFEVVKTPAVDELIRLILDRLPPVGQLVIASRRMPAIQVGRLRAQGELLEVEQLQLRFTREETATFMLEQQGLALAEADVSRLHGATEGWPAALWLARAALANRASPQDFIATFSGSDTAVAEYLAEEVLSQLPNDVQQFLLRTSILSELTPELCDAVCLRTDSQGLLRWLEQSNGGVTLIDAERRLYRYHALFASFLRAQLEHLSREEVPDLHGRASEWFQSVGRAVPAIEHALAGGRLEQAFAMLSAHIKTFLFDGRFRLLVRWLNSVPENSLRDRPELRVAHIWSLVFTPTADEALRQLNVLETRVAQDGWPLPPDLRQELEALRPLILSVLDRHEEGSWLAEEALKLDWCRDSFAYNLLVTMVASWRLAAARYDDAISLLGGVQPAERTGRASFSIVYATCVEGQVELIHGRVTQAIAQFRLAFNDIAATYGSRSVSKSIVAVYLAEALYEVDDLPSAEQLLTLYLPSVRELALPDLLIVAHVIQARIAFDRGDVDHAFRRLSELEYLGRQGPLPRALATAQLERARLALLRGDVAEAQGHVQRARVPEAWSGLRGLILPANDVETVELAEFRLAAHGVDRAEALVNLKAHIYTAQSKGRKRRAFKYKIVLACVQQASGQARQALRTMQEALEAACPQGLVRAFVDEGRPAIDLVREVRVSRSGAGHGDTDPTLSAFMDRILRRAGVKIDSSPAPEFVADATVTLSVRELCVLQSVARGLPNAAIAEVMFVAETTVRAHLRKINVKLGASNRTQAVAAARQLGLLH